MTGTNVFLQIGASRDGTDSYLKAARRRGLAAWLIETSEYAHCRTLLGRREFDRTITLANPSDPSSVVEVLSHLGVNVVMMLPGFEQYTECAHVVARWLGLPPSYVPSGHEPLIFHPVDKAGQRACIESSVPWVRQPRYVTLEASHPDLSATTGLRLPLVIKPVNGGGGLGVFLVRTLAELPQVLATINSLSNYDGHNFKSLIVEEYVSGIEYSVQGICCDGQPRILTFCEKLIAQEEFSDGEPFIGFREIGHLAVNGEHTPTDMQDFTADCLRAVGYRNGPFHIDMIRTSEGLHFIEMGFRLSGGGLTEVVKRVSGLDWGEQSFAWLLERKPVDASPRSDGICLAQLVAKSESEIGAARDLRRLGYEVEIRFCDPAQIADTLSAEEAVALQADLSRHIGRIGFIWITAAATDELRRLARWVITGQEQPPEQAADRTLVSAYE